MKMPDERLIECVRNREFLYNLAHEKYMDPRYKAIAWKEIGEELNQPAARCKKRWSNIRDQYRKHRLKCSQVRSGQAADIPVRKYKYQDNLKFLSPFFQEREMLLSFQRTCSLTPAVMEDSAASPPENLQEAVEKLETGKVAVDDQRQQPKRSLRDVQVAQDKLMGVVDRCVAMLDQLQSTQPAVAPAATATLATTLPVAPAAAVLPTAAATPADANLEALFAFYRSVAITVSRFDREKQWEAQDRITQIMRELEMRNINN